MPHSIVNRSACLCWISMHVRSSSSSFFCMRFAFVCLHFVPFILHSIPIRNLGQCSRFNCIWFVLKKKFFNDFAGGRFCSFSPCIEQSQRFCEELEKHGFVEIQSLELVQIEEIVKTKNVPVLELDFVKHKVSVERH